MTTPESPAGDDTKVCPFCAETIKRAAIKCRFCQSDLQALSVQEEVPDATEEPFVPPQVVPTEETPPPPEPAPEPPAPPAPAEHESVEVIATRTPMWARIWVVVALVAAVALAGLAANELRKSQDLANARDAAAAVRATVGDQVQRVLSYTPEAFEETEEAARTELTESFREEYEPTLDTIRAGAESEGRSQQAQVLAVAVVDAEPDRVETLLYVNTLTSAEGDENQRLMQNRINVTLVREDDRWLIDDVTFPQS